MTKSKSKKVICAPSKNCSKNHKIPKDVIPIIGKLKSLAFVACVNTPGFQPSNKAKGIKVVGFDDIKNSYNVKVFVKDYEQRLYVRIKGEKKDRYKVAIENTSY